MLKDDEANKELFDPDSIIAVNTASKLPIYNSFTWTQNIYVLDKARVPKDIRDLLKQFKAEKERLDKNKQTLPPITSESKRKDDSSLAGSKLEAKPEQRPKNSIVNEASNSTKKRSEISLVRSLELLTEDTFGTEDNSRKHVRGLNRKKTKQGKRSKISAEDKLKAEFESIDNLVKAHSSETTVKNYVAELVKEAKNKRLLNPERYLRDSERLFNPNTILSNAAMRKSQELQARIANTFAKLNPSRASHLSLTPETSTGAGGNAVRMKYQTPSPEPTAKVMMTKLKGLMKTQSQLHISKGQAIPFTLMHTLTKVPNHRKRD